MSVATAKALSSCTEISGSIKRIIFRNEQNNYMVICLKSEQVPRQVNPLDNEFIAIGHFSRITEGLHLSLSGSWIKNSKHGWQFIVKTHEIIPPETNKALVGFLSSGLFRGIGKKTGERIVKRFGKETLEVIEKRPELLQEVKGISSTKAKAICDSYRESKNIEQLMMSLHPFNISMSKIYKIHQKYGEQAMNMIIENPYSLCSEVRGIGFKTADAIAANLCQTPINDDYRIGAALRYALMAGAQEGHSYLPFKYLAKKTKQILQTGPIKGRVAESDIIRVAINLADESGLIVEEDNATYLPYLYKHESYSARKLRSLLRSEPKEFDLDFDLLISEMEYKTNMTYASKQKKAFHAIKDTNLLVITGGPGTGKTTLIKGLLNIYKENKPDCKIALAAPTGRAAKRMTEATGHPAKTIHRLIEYQPHNSNEEDAACGKNEEDPIDADLIIVDESSMIDLYVFSIFLRAVKPDTTLVLVGDVDQLPSVGAGNVLSDMINSNEVPVVRLDEIFRQKDTSKIIVNANKINSGEKDLEFNEKDFFFIERKQEEDIQSVIRYAFKRFHEKLTKDVGGDVALHEVQVLTPFRRHTEIGSNTLNEIIQADFNSNPNLPEFKYGTHTFRKYDKVMQYRNNYEKEVFNGDVGTIVAIYEEGSDSVMTVQYDDKEVDYARDELDEVQLAYASTIHKSQGCEYDTIIVPVSFRHKIMLQRNLLYTAITRAKNSVVLIGEKEALRYAIQNNKVTNRFSKLDQRI